MKTLFTLLCLCLGLGLAAQTTHVSGKITDGLSGEPVAFATIYCQSCAYGGTVSNADGGFELESARIGDTLKIYHLMYARADREASLRSRLVDAPPGRGHNAPGARRDQGVHPGGYFG